MRTLFKGGTVVSGGGVRRGDLLVENEKVAALGRNLKAEADRVIDVSGCYLFPGFVDAHTHFDLEVAGTVTADGFASGSRAALRGGTTTVIDFACPDKGESLHSGLERWRKKADGQTFCDYGFHMTIDDWNEAIRGELGKFLAVTPRGHKLFVPDDVQTHNAIAQLQQYIYKVRPAVQDEDSARPMTHHGLRHSYAARTWQELVGSGVSPFNASLRVSQLLGHERPDVTQVYLASVEKEDG